MQYLQNVLVHQQLAFPPVSSTNNQRQPTPTSTNCKSTTKNTPTNTPTALHFTMDSGKTTLPSTKSESTKTKTPSISSTLTDDTLKKQHAPEIHPEGVHEKPNKVKRFLSKFQSSAVRSTAELDRRDKEEEIRTGIKKKVEPPSLLSVCEAVTNAEAKCAWAAI
jgi:hypothetical protein